MPSPTCPTAPAFSLGLALFVCLAIPLQAGGQPGEPSSAEDGRPTQLRERDRHLEEMNRLRREGDLPGALAAGEKMLALERQHFGDVHEEIAASQETLAQLHQALDNYPAARTARQEALAIYTKLLGPRHWQTTNARLAVADMDLFARLSPRERQRLGKAEQALQQAEALGSRGQYAEAIPLAAAALADRKELLGPEHPGTLTAMVDLGWFYRDSGQTDRAGPLLREAVRLRRKVQGENHPHYAHSLNVLGWFHRRCKEWDEAERCFRQALEVTGRSLGEGHPDHLTSLDNLVSLYRAQGEYGKAEPLSAQALRLRKQALGASHPDYASALITQAGNYHAQGKYAQAATLLREALGVRRKAQGEQHPDYATCLNNLAAVYEALGDYQRAELMYREVLRVRKKVLGEAHADYALALNNLGLLCQTLGRYREAESLLGQALEINRKALGEQHLSYALSLHNMAHLYDALADYARAEPLARQSLAVKKQLQGERHPSYLDSLHLLARVLQAQGNYREAEALHEQVLKGRRQVLGERHPDCVGSLLSLGSLYEVQGEYARAEPLLREALELRRKALGERHPYYARTLAALAGLYRTQGEYARAEPLSRQALAITRDALGGRHPTYGTRLHDLASLYDAQGEYARDERLYLEALEIDRLTGRDRHPSHATTLLNLGLLYYARGEYRNAQRVYQQALEIHRQTVGERHAHFANVLNSLAGVYDALGEKRQAEKLYRQALEVRRQALGEHHPDVASSLHNLAALYRELKEYDRAEPLAREEVAIRERALGKRHIQYAASLNNLGAIYYDRGDYRRAEELNRDALPALLADPEAGPKELGELTPADLRPHHETLRFLHNHALTLKKQLRKTATADQLRACDRTYALTLGLLERVRQEKLEEEESKVKVAADRFELVPQRLSLLRRLVELEGKREDLEEAVHTAEQGTARAFLEALGRSRGQVLGGVAPALRQQEHRLMLRLRELEDRIDRESARPPERRDPAVIAELYGQRRQCAEELRVLLGTMAQAYPQYAALRHPRPCTLAEARACLGRDEVALLFVPGEVESFVVLLEPAGGVGPGIGLYSLPGARDLEEAVAALVDTNTLESATRVRARGAELYQALLGPVADRARGKGLVVVPNGVLCKLPFELLITEDGKYLVEGHGIRYAPSLTALHLSRQWEQKRSRPEALLWAAGDPVYDGQDERLGGKADLAATSKAALEEYLSRLRSGGADAKGYARLKFSGEELRRLRALLQEKGVETLTGLQASEGVVKAASEKGELARYRYLHFATHGILGLDRGRQPALVLSLVGNEQEDGFLQMDEVTNLKLNADLVVLSACQTGKGKLSNGEGVRGLARAFLYAGSRGVVCSLWSVDDRATADLMTSLYRRLGEGRPAAEALRQAQLEMIRQGRPPLYWAPFVLIGE